MTLGLTVAIAAHGSHQTPPQATTATLAGRVVADNPQQTPIRGALVLMTDGVGRSRSAVTDDAGAFEFKELPASRYVVTASKPPFVPIVHSAEACRSTGHRRGRVARTVNPGRPDSIAPRRGRDGNAAQSKSGETMPDVQVTAIRMDPPDGQAASSASSGTPVMTDDRGVYRIYGLPPGKYYDRGGRSDERRGRSNRRSIHGRRGSRVCRDSTIPDAGALPGPRPLGRRRRLRHGCPQLSLRRHSFRGPCLPAMRRSSFWPAATCGRLISRSCRSRPVQSRVSFRPMTVRRCRPSCRLSIPPGHNCRCTFATRPGALVMEPGRDGRFKFDGVLRERTRSSLAAAPARGAAAGTRLWVRTDVVFSGADVTGVTLMLRPGLRVAGRVVFEGSAPRPALNTIQVTLYVVDGRDGCVRAERRCQAGQDVGAGQP